MSSIVKAQHWEVLQVNGKCPIRVQNVSVARFSHAESKQQQCMRSRSTGNQTADYSDYTKHPLQPPSPLSHYYNGKWHVLMKA